MHSLPPTQRGFCAATPAPGSATRHLGHVNTIISGDSRSSAQHPLSRACRPADGRRPAAATPAGANAWTRSKRTRSARRRSAPRQNRLGRLQRRRGLCPPRRALGIIGSEAVGSDFIKDLGARTVVVAACPAGEKRQRMSPVLPYMSTWSPLLMYYVYKGPVTCVYDAVDGRTWSKGLATRWPGEEEEMKAR